MRDDKPIDRMAQELANSGDYGSFEELEPKLIDSFGQTAVNLFRQNREARREVNELCKAARKPKPDRRS